MARGFRWRVMDMAGGHMEWGLAGARLIMDRGITIPLLGGAFWERSRGAGRHITMAAGCFSRALDGCGARRERMAAVELGAGGQ